MPVHACAVKSRTLGISISHYELAVSHHPSSLAHPAPRDPPNPPPSFAFQLIVSCRQASWDVLDIQHNGYFPHHVVIIYIYTKIANPNAASHSHDTDARQHIPIDSQMGGT